MENQILALIMYCLPAVVTGVIACLFFKGYTHNENKRRDFILNEFAQGALVVPQLADINVNT